VAWLLKNGVPATSILVITFTNKAAGELKVGSKHCQAMQMGCVRYMFKLFVNFQPVLVKTFAEIT
jgi:hypothetical protein